MAEIFPDEGINFILNVFPRREQNQPLQLGLGLFTGTSGTTVPPRDTVLAGNPTIVAEPLENNMYRRIVLPNTAWGVPVVSGAGMRTTTTEQVFPQSSGPWGLRPVAGVFVATTLIQGTGIALLYANFDDGKDINVNSGGYTIRVAPFWQMDG